MKINKIKLNVEFLPNGNFYKLCKQVIIDIGTKKLRLHKGFISRFPFNTYCYQIIFPSVKNYTKAALAHYFLYTFRLGTRHQADKTFYSLMSQLHIHPIPKTLIYLTTRSFSWVFWHCQARKRRKNKHLLRMQKQILQKHATLF